MGGVQASEKKEENEENEENEEGEEKKEDEDNVEESKTEEDGEGGKSEKVVKTKDQKNKANETKKEKGKKKGTVEKDPEDKANKGFSFSFFFKEKEKVDDGEKDEVSGEEEEEEEEEEAEEDEEETRLVDESDFICQSDVPMQSLQNDRLTELIGEYGPWQFFFWLLPCLSLAVSGAHLMSTKLQTSSPRGHWCARPGHLRHVLNVSEWQNVSAPLSEDGTLDLCNRFDLNYTADSVRPVENTSILACEEWEYGDDQLMNNTIITDWNFVCDKAYFRDLFPCAFTACALVGVFVSGFLSDIFGRKPTYLGFLTIWIFVGALDTILNNGYVWLATRLVCILLNAGFYNVISVYAIEMTNEHWRSRASHWFLELWFVIGYVGFFAPTLFWPKAMSLYEPYISLSACPCLVLWYFMYDSPRWLFVKERKEGARASMYQACKWNQKLNQYIDDYVDKYKSGTNYDVNSGFIFLNLMRRPGMRANLLILLPCWLAIGLGFGALGAHVPSIAWDSRLDLALPAVSFLPLLLGLPFVENNLGRKNSLVVTLFLTSLAMFLTALLPVNWPGANACPLAGLICCFAAFQVAHLFTLELFPTVLRGSALSLISSMGLVGLMIQQAVAAADATQKMVPLLVFAVVNLLACPASYFLRPEMLGFRCSDTIEECEKLYGATRAKKVVLIQNREGDENFEDKAEAENAEEEAKV